MIHAKDIKAILTMVPKGTAYSVTQIQTLVQQNFKLTPDDWAVHTLTRKTHYPKWHHRIQSVLSEYKRKEIVLHDSETNRYTFIR